MPFAPVPAKTDYFTALIAFLALILPPGTEIDQAQQNDVASPAGADYVILTEIARRRLSNPITIYADCAFTGTVQGTVLTVTAIGLGAILPGARLLGAGVADGTTIGAQSSGPTGKAGAYTLSVAQSAPVTGPLATGAALIEVPTEVKIQVDVYGPNSADNVETVISLFRDGYSSLWFYRQGYTAKGIAPLDIEEPRQIAFVDGEQNYEERWSVDLTLQVNQVVSPSQDFADAVNLTINPPGDNPVAAAG